MLLPPLEAILVYCIVVSLLQDGGAVTVDPGLSPETRVKTESVKTPVAASTRYLVQQLPEPGKETRSPGLESAKIFQHFEALDQASTS